MNDTDLELSKIPSSAAPFFQEFRLEKLRIDVDRALIIERILAYGNQEELKWLFRVYGWEAIKAWVAQSGERLLPKRRFRLWVVVFSLTEEEITHRVREPIWPY